MKFSIIVVCLNPGQKLNQTIRSILNQDYQDYEILVKDGGSKDHSIEELIEDEHIRLYVEKDSSIYDAMNQAVAHAQGDFIIFMNCGDSFHDAQVLKNIAEGIAGQPDQEKLILYGKIYNEKTRTYITPSPKIDGFACYRNVPCHQSCVYAASLCKEKPYETQYRIRGDYEHFLWCYYKAKANFLYLDEVIADYEGGGFSETPENIRKSRLEHEKITAIYMSKGELFRYKTILLLTLAPLRKKLAESKRFASLYQRMVSIFYR